MTRGRDEVISVDSDPSGAKATILCAGNISVNGTTPARLTIPRKADLCRVDVEKSGMQRQKIQLERGFSAPYWLNLVPTIGFPAYVVASGPWGGSSSTAYGWLAFALAGAAGLVVDRVTGAMYDHKPHVIKITLQPEH
ncbi:MAG: hypothetical protein QOK37_620 [Thermoanaerobaculia bacterium]|jgi:hypothetical protein|nr:hypothetical protein [Thermoanaerobaculia bacterium]